MLDDTVITGENMAKDQSGDTNDTTVTVKVSGDKKKKKRKPRIDTDFDPVDIDPTLIDPDDPRAEEVIRAQREYRELLDALGNEDRGKPGRNPIYRLTVERIKPIQKRMVLPTIELNLDERPFDICEVPRRYGGGVYDLRLYRGQKRVPEGRRPSVAFPGEAKGFVADGANPWEGGELRSESEIVAATNSDQANVAHIYEKAMMRAERQSLQHQKEMLTLMREMMVGQPAAPAQPVQPAPEQKDPIEQMTAMFAMFKTAKDMIDEVTPEAPRGNSSDAALYVDLAEKAIQGLPGIVKMVKDIWTDSDTPKQTGKEMELAPVHTLGAVKGDDE